VVYANCMNWLPLLNQHDMHLSEAIIRDSQHSVLTRKDRLVGRATRAGCSRECGLLARP
jgi:hypothetical protein